jgi:hypothetical protein
MRGQTIVSNPSVRSRVSASVRPPSPVRKSECHPGAPGSPSARPLVLFLLIITFDIICRVCALTTYASGVRWRCEIFIKRRSCA